MVGMTAVAAMLGWLQLAPAFGFPVTAPAPMVDRALGAHREAGLAGWVLLLLGLAAFALFYLFVVEPRAHRIVVPLAYATGAWLLTGVLLMPVIALVQGTPPAGAAANDPMRATFFMFNLGPGAAAEALVGWLLFGAVLAAGRRLEVRSKVFWPAVGAAVLAGGLAWAAPVLAVRTVSSRVVEGQVAAPPRGHVFISVLELPQPPGEVLGPHRHVAGLSSISGGPRRRLSAARRSSTSAPEKLSSRRPASSTTTRIGVQSPSQSPPASSSWVSPSHSYCGPGAAQQTC